MFETLTEIVGYMLALKEQARWYPDTAHGRKALIDGINVIRRNLREDSKYAY